MKQSLLKSGFARDTLIVLGGSVLAQAIPIVLSPLITRLYTPEDMGLVALYTAIVTILGVAATGRYELAVMLPEESDDATQVVALAALIGLLVCVVSLAFILGLNAEMTNLLASPDISPWLYLIPLSILLLGVYQTLNYWLIRQKAFGKSVLNKLSQTSFTAVPSVVLGVLQVSGGLLYSYIVGWIAGSVFAFWQALRTGYKPASISREGIKANAVRYQDLPKYSALPALLDGASLAIPLVLVSTFFLSAAAGYFALVRQVILGPISLVSSSISQVFFQRVVEKKKQGLPLSGEVIGIMWRLGLFSAACAAIGMLIAPDLFAFVFGEKWRVAGEYARILAIPYAVRFVASPLSMIFTALDRVKMGSLWQILYFVTLLPLFLLGSLTMEKFLLIYAALEFFVYVIYILMLLWVVKVYDQNLGTEEDQPHLDSF